MYFSYFDYTVENLIAFPRVPSDLKIQSSMIPYVGWACRRRAIVERFVLGNFLTADCLCSVDLFMTNLMGCPFIAEHKIERKPCGGDVLQSWHI